MNNKNQKTIFQKLRSAVLEGDILHGSKTPDLTVLEPRQAKDVSGNFFKNQNGVYGARVLEVAVAMALLDKKDRKVEGKSGWNFYGEKNPETVHGEIFGDDNTVLTPGYIYVLPQTTFQKFFVDDSTGDYELISFTRVVPKSVTRVIPEILEWFPRIRVNIPS
jgi:hypothetical protein